MINLRGLLVLAFAALILIAMGVKARAADLPLGVTCPDVRSAIATVAKQTGKTMTEAVVIVEAMARSAGATDQQIAAARRCK